MRMSHIASAILTLTLEVALAGAPAAQAPSGPLPPKPGTAVQQPPKDTQAKVKVQVALVNTPVTVRNVRGDMVHDLEAANFRISDNGVAQQISHFHGDSDRNKFPDRPPPAGDNQNRYCLHANGDGIHRRSRRSGLQ